MDVGTILAEGNLIRTNLVIPHDNVWFVLCGHKHDEYTRIENLNGHDVFQLLADYQSRPNGGNGWLRTMRFSPADNKVYVQTYSPSLNQYETDGNSEFALDMPLNAFSLIGTQNVSSGTNASVTWLDPTPGGLNEPLGVFL